ncbi:MAG: ferric reductase-like transmembrane domain-containing protein [Actinomycetota bacterium]
MTSQVWWYFARSSGMVAAILLMASFVWGVLMATRALKPVDRPSWMLAMHRWFAGLAVTATALHVGSLIADSYVHFGAKEVLVPFASTWRPTAVAIGVVSMYILAVVQITSWLMKRMSKKVWRGIHMSSYVLVWMVFLHAGLSGTDTSNRVYRIVAVVLAIVVATAAILRIRLGRPAAARAAARAAGTPAAARPNTARSAGVQASAPTRPSAQPLPPPVGVPVARRPPVSADALGDPLISAQRGAGR